MDSDERPQLYISCEQAARLAAIACDTLSGMQIESTCDADSDVTGCYVPIESPTDMRFFRITHEGYYTDET